MVKKSARSNGRGMRRPKKQPRIHVKAVRAVTAEINEYLARQRYQSALDLIDRATAEVAS